MDAPCRAQYTLSILPPSQETKDDKDPKIRALHESAGSVKDFKTQEEGWGFLKFYPAATFLRPPFCVKNCVTLEARVTVVGDIDTTPVSRLTAKLAIYSTLTADFGKLLCSREGSDVVFVLDEQQELPAHWFVLTARSPFFAVSYYRVLFSSLLFSSDWHLCGGNIGDEEEQLRRNPNRANSRDGLFRGRFSSNPLLVLHGHVRPDKAKRRDGRRDEKRNRGKKRRKKGGKECNPEIVGG